jgi:pimeloyl-ACP methyl ester carboxylesterase
MLSVPQMINYLAAEHHIPAPVTWLAVKLTNIRIESDINQIDVIRFPPKIRPPALILQGAADPIMPLTVVHAFLQNGRKIGWKIQYAEFPHAGHNESWTTDAERYEAIVSNFLEDIKQQSAN